MSATRDNLDQLKYDPKLQTKSARFTPRSTSTAMTPPTCFSSGQMLRHAHIWFKAAFNEGQYAIFKAYVTNYSDSWNSSWNTEGVFARMDPIATFQRTSRKINLTFKVVADSAADAQCGIAQVEKLIGFMYPVWDPLQIDVRPTPQAPPLIEMRWSNLIHGTVAPEAPVSESDRGLIGFIGSLNVNHDVEAGWLFTNKNMYPKEITISFDFTVIHEFAPGITSNFTRGHQYPYGQYTKKKCFLGADPPDRRSVKNRGQTPAADGTPSVPAGVPQGATNNGSTNNGSTNNGSTNNGSITGATNGDIVMSLDDRIGVEKDKCSRGEKSKESCEAFFLGIATIPARPHAAGPGPPEWSVEGGPGVALDTRQYESSLMARIAQAPQTVTGPPPEPRERKGDSVTPSTPAGRAMARKAPGVTDVNLGRKPTTPIPPLGRDALHFEGAK